MSKTDSTYWSAADRRRWAIELVASNLPHVDVVREAERICSFVWPPTIEGEVEDAE